MFQPELTLVPQPDGSFTLIVKALVPDTCYTGATLKPGFPPGGVLIPEALPFAFEIAHHRGVFCAQHVHYVSASLAGIKPDAGHQFVLVFSVVDGRVVGHASASFPPVEQVREMSAAKSPPGWIIPDSVSATVFSGIVGPAELRVTCLVATPTPGYTATLEPAVPQGINPATLLLRLTLTPPNGPVIQIPSTVLAQYEIKPYHGRYRDVTILNGSQIVTVPVRVIFSVFEAGKNYEFSTG